MKRVYLRVLRSGDILVRDNGEDPSLCLSKNQTTGIPRNVQLEPAEKVRVLPFYSLTNREEQELLYGRAYTHMVLCQDKVNDLKAELARLDQETTDLGKKLEVVIQSEDNLSLPKMVVGIVFKERKELAEQLQQDQEDLRLALVKLAAQEKKTVETTYCEVSQSRGKSGNIPSDFGKHE